MRYTGVGMRYRNGRNGRPLHAFRGQNGLWGLAGGRFLKMGFLAKNGQNGPGLDLYRGRGPMTYLDPRFRVLEFSKLRASMVHVPGPARDYW